MNKQQIEKVKQGCKCCSTDEYKCNECPYWAFGVHNNICTGYVEICADALTVIEQMEQEIDDLRADLPSCEEGPEETTPENLLGMSENARIERVIDKLRLMRRQFRPGSKKSGVILDAMFFLRLMQNRSIEAGDKE